MNWPIEIPIPDKDFLFTRIFKDHISRQDSLPKAEAFRNTPFNSNSKDLSSDWDKYASAEYCRESVKRQKNKKGIVKDPNDYFIWKMNVGDIRNKVIPSQKVLHTPRPHNRAHSSIIGNKFGDEKVNNAELRSILVEIGLWVIKP